MRAEPGNLLLPVNWVYIRKLLVLIYLDELTPTQRLGRVLPLGEVSRKLGFKLAVFRDQQEHFFFRAAGFWAKLETLSVDITHLLNYYKNLNK